MLVDKTRLMTPFVVIGADINGHNAWWGPPHLPSNANGEPVEVFILSQSMEVLNHWLNPATFISEQGQEFWIDLTLNSS